MTPRAWSFSSSEAPSSGPSSLGPSSSPSSLLPSGAASFRAAAAASAPPSLPPAVERVDQGLLSGDLLICLPEPVRENEALRLATGYMLMANRFRHVLR